MLVEYARKIHKKFFVMASVTNLDGLTRPDSLDSEALLIRLFTLSNRKLLVVNRALREYDPRRQKVRPH